MATQPTVHPESSEGKKAPRPAANAPSATPEAAARGLRFERFYTTPGVHPYDTVEWEQRDAVISNEKGEIVFEQRGVEIPKAWSQTATNVVVSKYFRGQLGTPQRERSVRQLISAIETYLARHNLAPKRYLWHAKGEDILAKILRARAALQHDQTA